MDVSLSMSFVIILLKLTGVVKLTVCRFVIFICATVFVRDDI